MKSSERKILDKALSAAALALEQEDPAKLRRESFRLSLARSLYDVRREEEDRLSGAHEASRRTLIIRVLAVAAVVLLLVLGFVRLPSVDADLSADVQAISFVIHNNWQPDGIFEGDKITIQNLMQMGFTHDRTLAWSSAKGSLEITLDGRTKIEEIVIKAPARITLQQDGDTLNLIAAPLVRGKDQQEFVTGRAKITAPSVASLPDHRQLPVTGGSALYFTAGATVFQEIQLVFEHSQDWDATVQAVDQLDFTIPQHGNSTGEAYPADAGRAQRSSIVDGTLDLATVSKSFPLRKRDDLVLSDPIGELRLGSAIVGADRKVISVGRTGPASTLDVTRASVTRQLKPTLLDWLLDRAGVIETIWGLLGTAAVALAFWLPLREA